MTVYIVLKNGKVHEVFDNLIAARRCVVALSKKGTIVELIEKEMNTDES